MTQTQYALDLWNKAWLECLGDKDLTLARVGGRVSKDKPNKEDVGQWQKQGPAWLEDYIKWRKNNPEWQIWHTDAGVPAIELELNPIIAGIPVKMGIDRIFDIGGELVIVDLKTSQSEPKNPLQLGFYKYGIKKTFGIDVKWGSYYMSRTSGTTSMIDLSWYEDEKIEYLVKQFDKARRAGVFLPNADNCGICGFTKICQFTSKRGSAQ